jgi:VWFA-related protein
MSARRGIHGKTLRQGTAVLLAYVLGVAPATLPLGASLGPPRRARDKQEAQVQTGTRIRREVNLVLVEATVKDKSGRVMGELKQEDFRVSENGAAQRVAHFSRDQLPLAVALVVDLSGSIQPFLRPLRYASMTALKSLKAEDQVALIIFSDRAELRVELTGDKASVADEFETLSAEGSTNINDAVYEAARYLRDEAPAARRVIVLVSDTVPTNPGRVEHKRVVEAALEADAAVYALKIPGRNTGGLFTRTQRTVRGMVNVSKLTAETGGEIFDIEKEGSLFLAFKALIERLKTRYTLGYYPAENPSDANFRRLDLALTATHGAKGRDYTILAKTGYYPPPRAMK